jgi:hypothetical protein
MEIERGRIKELNDLFPNKKILHSSEKGIRIALRIMETMIKKKHALK